MVGRIRRAGGGQEAARADRAAQPAADPDAALQPVQFGARQPAGAVRHSVRGRRRHPRALCRRPQLQRLGRGRLHLAVRRLGDGWHPADVLHPPRHRGGHGHRGRHHPRRRNAHAADLHDRPVGLHRPGAGGDLDRHRLAGAAAAGLRHRRRHAAVADLQPAGDPDGGAARSCRTSPARRPARPGWSRIRRSELRLQARGARRSRGKRLSRRSAPAQTRSSAPSWRRRPSAPARPSAESARRRAPDRGRSRD